MDRSNSREAGPANDSAVIGDAEDAALLHLLAYLKRADYRFAAITPLSHARVVARPLTGPVSLRDIFGWNRTFDSSDLDESIFRRLCETGLISRSKAGWRSEVRVSSLETDLYLHSAFPTEEQDAVFFGPDTYRFIRFIKDELGPLDPGSSVVDMGTGSGAAGLCCARLRPNAKITLVDLNPKALKFSRVNATAAGIDVGVEQRSTVPPGARIVVANPPYMIDSASRDYRDGGDLLGGAVAFDWVRQALASMLPGGRMLLYSGFAMVDGSAPALEAIRAECERSGAGFTCRELDPDVFGEELCNPAYANVERIAVIGCVLTLPA